jgi:hypothetical protein
VAEYTTLKDITFTGTPPFDLVLSTGKISVNEGYKLPDNETLVSFTDKTGAPGTFLCIPLGWYGSIDFPVFSVPKDQGVTFSATANLSISGVTYKWSAPYFDPDKGSEASFSTKAPADSKDYPVTLTAQSEGYCDLSVTHDVPVVDCHGGRLGDSPGQACPDNNGGRIGNTN